jgi:murein DD-endopeptidase MepM/ murein hydrolase activator NlpD
MILLGVTSEVFSSYTDNIKKKIIKNMFWGRGYLFKLSLQFASVIILVILTSSYFYRSPTVSAQFETQAQVQTSDVLTMKGSTMTDTPEDRGNTEPETYVVKVGDTVSGIAQDNGISSETIRWANDLEEYTVIKPGQELKIPQGDGVLITARKGDNVEKLAKKYNSSPQLIIAQNQNLFPPDFELTVGEDVFIPDGRIPEPVRPTTPVYSGVIATSPNLYLNSSPVVPGVGRFLNWPVAGGRGRLTQCYSGWHNGIDIADAGYPDLVAAASGTVSFAGCQSGSCPAIGSQVGGYGLAWAVVIDHGNGLSTVYGHMNQIYVKRGQFVSAGQSLGQMGRSGTAYGTHVHFMVLNGGSWRGINPSPYMRTHICGY